MGPPDRNRRDRLKRLREETAEKTRSLTQGEVNLIPRKLKTAIDPAKVRLVNRAHNPFASGKYMARGNTIYWPGKMPEDFTGASLETQAILMHELCHVWQYKAKRLSAFKYLTSPSHQKYTYVFDAKKTFNDYKTEQQADIVQDWYLTMKKRPASNSRGCMSEKGELDANCKPTYQQLDTLVQFKPVS